MWVLWMLFYTESVMATDKLYFQEKAACETARAQVNALHPQPLPGLTQGWERISPDRMTICLPAGFVVPREK